MNSRQSFQLYFLGDHRTQKSAPHLGVAFIPFGIDAWTGEDDSSVNPASPVVGVVFPFSKFGIEELDLTGRHLVLHRQGELTLSDFIVGTGPVFFFTDRNTMKDFSFFRPNDNKEATTVWKQAIFLAFRFDHGLDLLCDKLSCFESEFRIDIHDSIFLCLCFDIYIIQIKNICK